jgi:hypothetical protein
MKTRGQRRKRTQAVYQRRINWWKAARTPEDQPGAAPVAKLHFLKHTSTPCSCWMCQGEQYKRQHRSKRVGDE